MNSQVIDPAVERVAPAEGAPPLVLDVDGTLIATDLLQESLLQLVAHDPVQLLRLPLWLSQGRSKLKAELAARVDPEVDTVPLRPEALALIGAAQAVGRPVYLASASERRLVEGLAERIGGMAGVFGTEPGRPNLSGQAKAERLTAEFGPKGFDYAGDRAVDLPVWRAARKAIVVTDRPGFAAGVKRELPNAEVVAHPAPSPRAAIRALRLHQWAKNVLVFLPMIGGHYFDLATILASVAAFFCFCFAASSTYIINDLLDLPGDRDHPRKRNRPFASGKVPVLTGMAMSAVLMALALSLSLLLPGRFVLVLLTYVVTTLAYSLVLKRKVLIDIVVLGGLYTVRVYGGITAANSYQTQWILMFSLFLFLSLATVKRCSELEVRRAAGKTWVAGRGYRVEDMAALLPLAAAAGVGAVLVFALYISSPEVTALYLHPHRLWLISPLLAFWISRLLVFANRGDLHDDPVVFALTDRTSLVTLGLSALVVAFAI